MKIILVVCAILLADLRLWAAEKLPAEPVVYYDMASLFALDLKDPVQRRRFWDETHLVISLQGLVNRQSPRLFIRYVRQPDDFWWEQMRVSGGWLAGRPVVRVERLEELLGRFAPYYRGAVVWDERVPSTSNLASTIAGCDDLLCLRLDMAPDSLYGRLAESGPRIPIRVRLVGADGGPLFSGKGVIPGTERPSSGSAKCDAYLWLIEHYVKAGRTNPHQFGYYLDGFWLQCWNASSPENHTLSNHDYIIAQRGVLFDLNVWEDEACVDDPGQPAGTDMATLQALLRAAWDRFRGEGVMHAAGFVPWAYKYTTHRGGTWAAGGTHEPVPTEWRYAEILSCFNAYMDADALGLGAMANASFFRHYPLRERYPQPNRPDRAGLQARGLLDGAGRIARRQYVAHYVGDYDAAAWLYQQLPRMWRDPARGTTPLAWAFNPNLAERFPLGMAWARERATTNDVFVAGDSGAGYLNPGYLAEPRRYSGLPSGVAAWEKHCRRFYEQWDLDVTGFVIDGYAPAMPREVLDAYARFSPGGIVAQKVPLQGLHGEMPVVRMRTDVDGSPADAARTLASLSGGPLPQFVVARSILKPPRWYAEVERELARIGGEEIRVVDLPTLLWLVREFETNRAVYVDTRWAQAEQVRARPGQPEGLYAMQVPDGPLEQVEREGHACWVSPKHTPPRYVYFNIADEFHRPQRPGEAAAVEIELQYWDAGGGLIELQYDSTDATAPLEGAYKPHPDRVRRGNTGRWQEVRFGVADGRFAGSQNGAADFRFYNGGDELLVREVRVRRVRE